MMSSFLIDTQILIWWMKDGSKLSQAASAVLKDSKSEIKVSLVAIWEISIKAKIGKLEHGDDILDNFERFSVEGGFSILYPETRDIAALRALPLHHNDPFDRLLIAQAQTHDLPLVTSDKVFKAYDVRVVW